MRCDVEMKENCILMYVVHEMKDSCTHVVNEIKENCTYVAYEMNEMCGPRIHYRELEAFTTFLLQGPFLVIANPAKKPGPDIVQIVIYLIQLNLTPITSFLCIH